MADKKEKKGNVQASNERGELKFAEDIHVEQNPAVRNFIFLVAGVVLIICLCMSAYIVDMLRRNAQTPVPQNTTEQNNQSQNNNGQTTSDTNVGSTQVPNAANPNTPSTNQTPNTAEQPSTRPGMISPAAVSITFTGHSAQGYQKAMNSINEIQRTGVWKATQYEQGDIVSTYTVQRGDTLWQIAKAYYGSGAQWKKILSANSNKIGFLKNGEQALILPGQVLSLP
jgi:nucleoid-associated protein YgaU